MIFGFHILERFMMAYGLQDQLGPYIYGTVSESLIYFVLKHFLK